ncbi:MAG: helix-hairpin-helix domain-containing protein [Deltaproteobacteria bacterium]|nr:helix-hairpin-helix domain-containing protein [Deltaproteobacteria bacterium]
MMRVRKFVVVLLVVSLVVSLVPVVFADEMKPVNINTASADDLCTLSGIGKTVAQRIVDYRDLNGPFKTPEGLMEVKGVGAKIFDANKDRITIN